MTHEPRDPNHGDGADLERDAWLREALRHAPDANAAPPSAMRDAILRQARAATNAGRAGAAASSASDSSLAQRLLAGWRWLSAPQVAGALAGVMLATIVGLMWWERPMDEALQRPEPTAAAPAVTPDASTAGSTAGSTTGAAADSTVGSMAASTPAPTAQAEAPAAAKQAEGVTRNRPAASALGEPAREQREQDRVAEGLARRDAERSSAFAKDRREEKREQAEREERQAKKQDSVAEAAAMARARSSDKAREDAIAQTPARQPDVGADARKSAAAGSLNASADAAVRAPAPATAPAPAPTPSPSPAPAVAAAPAPVPAPATAFEAPRGSLRALSSATPREWTALLRRLEREPTRWVWQRDGGEAVPVTPALLAWLGSVDRSAAGRWGGNSAIALPAQPATRSNLVPSSGRTELRLLLDGELQATVSLTADGRLIVSAPASSAGASAGAPPGVPATAAVDAASLLRALDELPR